MNARAEIQLVRVRTEGALAAVRGVVDNTQLTRGLLDAKASDQSESRELLAKLGPCQRGVTKALGLVVFTCLDDGSIVLTAAETTNDAVSFLRRILVDGVGRHIVSRLSLVDGEKPTAENP